MFVILCSSVCFRNVGCWHVPVLGPVAFAQVSKKEDITLKHVVSLYVGCIMFSSGIPLEIKIRSRLESPASGWAANEIPDENTLRVFHHASNCIHFIRIRSESDQNQIRIRSESDQNQIRIRHPISDWAHQ